MLYICNDYIDNLIQYVDLIRLTKCMHNPNLGNNPDLRPNSPTSRLSSYIVNKLKWMSAH